MHSSYREDKRQQSKYISESDKLLGRVEIKIKMNEPNKTSLKQKKPYDIHQTIQSITKC